METPPVTTTQDERIMAALSHGSILLPVTGSIVPVIIWITQREKSRFIAFHSLQALCYHGVLILGWFIGMALYLGSFFAMFLGVALFGTAANDLFGLFPIIPFGVFGLILFAGALMVLYGLIGAVLCLQGKDFRYLLLGDFLDRRLQN